MTITPIDVSNSQCKVIISILKKIEQHKKIRVIENWVKNQNNLETFWLLILKIKKDILI